MVRTFLKDCRCATSLCDLDLTFDSYTQINNFYSFVIKRPARDACLCMGELQAPPAPPAPHFVFLITL